MLNTIVHGTPTEEPTLLIAHGLYGSGRNWGAVSKHLSANRQVVAVDMRNHGSSPRSSDNSYPAMASDLADVAESVGAPVNLLGHSMGGKASMVLALTRPELISRLILVDIAPVAYNHSQIQYVDAMKAVDLDQVTRRSDADKLLAQSVEAPALRAFFLQSLEFGDSGARWRLNLDVLGREMPKIVGFPSIEGRFDGPTIFITGETSDYLIDDYWPRIRALFPNATQEVIAGAGHWVHAEALKPFVVCAESFLQRTNIT
ncbi:MAG: alpha/beta fold hydrolase [Pseudomonadota bacterium]